MPQIDALLAPHRNIGWDFDGTLMGHPNSPLMHDYIRRFPAKRHWIVTFRSHGLEEEVFSLLRGAYYAGAPRRADFVAILSISGWAHYSWNRIMTKRRRGWNGAETLTERYWDGWKGRACQKAGITVMIDDDASAVRGGCEVHGIVYIHPSSFDEPVTPQRWPFPPR
ncbi:hypothetical protein [Muricoccus aerilatus]|uniref:hypothetical protein n=1 Tax=Muricoccus aerilatus TaxID=452982 RepID=UPI0005C2564E|nr:hypothetical protein [Roseomonas aerilata]